MQHADKTLVDYLISEHKVSLQPVAYELLRDCKDERVCFASAYNEAIAVAIRRGAPLASYAIDRRNLFNCCQGVRDDTVETLTCFWCARRFPYRRTASQNPIMWHNPALRYRCCEEDGTENKDFLGVSQDATKEIFGLDAYLSRYGNCDPDGPDLSQRLDEFADFYLDVPFAVETVKVLCCPEDRDCEDAACRSGTTCCEKCRIPVCLE